MKRGMKRDEERDEDRREREREGGREREREKMRMTRGGKTGAPPVFTLFNLYHHQPNHLNIMNQLQTDEAVTDIAFTTNKPLMAGRLSLLAISEKAYVTLGCMKSKGCLCLRCVSPFTPFNTSVCSAFWKAPWAQAMGI